jgi:hypothetical protein
MELYREDTGTLVWGEGVAMKKWHEIGIENKDVFYPQELLRTLLEHHLRKENVDWLNLLLAQIACQWGYEVANEAIDVYKLAPLGIKKKVMI